MPPGAGLLQLRFCNACVNIVTEEKIMNYVFKNVEGEFIAVSKDAQKCSCYVVLVVPTNSVEFLTPNVWNAQQVLSQQNTDIMYES